MDMKELIARQDQERAALLASLPADVQAAFQRLPLEGRHQLLRYVEDFNDPSQDFQRNLDLKTGMFLGAIGYAFTMGQLDSASYHCLFDFAQTLGAAPA